MKVRYADSTESLTVRTIYSWDHNSLPEMAMSTSSGPKDYLKNQAYVALNAAPGIDRVIMVRASDTPFFLIHHKTGTWHDVTGREVVIDNALPNERT